MRELSKSLFDETVQPLVHALQPEQVHLFGSHASGNPDRDSDLDLLVVVPETDASRRELARRGREPGGTGVPVHLVVCTTAEMDKWSQVGCNLIHTVAQKGRRGYAAAD